MFLKSIYPAGHFVVIAATSILIPFTTQGANGMKTDTIDAHQTLQTVSVNAQRINHIRSSLPVQTITDKEISGLNATNVADVAQHFAGVNVKDYGGIGGLKTISIRGLGALHTGICYDGLMMSDIQSGQIDLSRFSIENIAAVSLYNGHPSDLLQPARMFSYSGIMSFMTRKPDNTSHISGNIKLKYGSFNTFNPSLTLSKWITSKWYIALMSNAVKSDGDYNYKGNLLADGSNTEEKRRINSDVKSLNSELNSGYQISNMQTITVKVNQYYSERGLPGPNIMYSTYSTDRALEKNYLSQLLYKNTTSCYFQYQLGLKYNKSDAQYSEKRSTYTTMENNTRIDSYHQNEYYMTGAFQTFPIEWLALSGSVDYSYNDLHSGSNLDFHETSEPVRQTILTNIAAKFISERVTFIANTLYTYTHETNAPGFDVAADRKRFAPSASISWQPLSDDNFRLRAFYKNIFRLPTFIELYYNDFGYTKLTPEITNQINIGGIWSKEFRHSFFNKMVGSLDLYYNTVKDKIVTKYGMPYSSVRNMGEVSGKGLDLSLDLTHQNSSNSELNLKISYTLQLTQDMDKESTTYKDFLPYTPVHSGSGALTYSYKKIRCGYNFVFSGVRYTGANNDADNYMNAYIDQNIFTSCSINKFEITAELNNILNNNYFIIKDYPMPGRNYRLIVSYKL